MRTNYMMNVDDVMEELGVKRSKAYSILKQLNDELAKEGYVAVRPKNKIMREKNQVVPDEMLSKEFLSRFKTESDVSRFLKQLHAQVLEKMLEGEMDAHLGYEKNSVAGNNSGNSRNGSYPKRIRLNMGKQSSPFRVTVMANLSR